MKYFLVAFAFLVSGCTGLQIQGDCPEPASGANVDVVACKFWKF